MTEYPMPIEEHDIDVAISFKSEDANLANDVNKRGQVLYLVIRHSLCFLG